MENVNPISLFMFEKNFFNDKKKTQFEQDLPFKIFPKDLRHFTTLAPKLFPFDTIG